jgi:hypothetical protein
LNHVYGPATNNGQHYDDGGNGLPFHDHISSPKNGAGVVHMHFVGVSYFLRYFDCFGRALRLESHTVYAV